MKACIEYLDNCSPDELRLDFKAPILMWIFDFFSGPHSFNDKKKESGRFKRCWSYNGHLEAGFKKEWDTLEEGLVLY